MILSRITEALREQNWFAVAIEFVIVILGVVIGFQISAWNEARMAREDYRNAIGEIRAQIRADIDEIDGQLARIDGLLTLAAEVLPALERCEAPAGGMAAVDALINQVGNDFVPTLESRGAERLLTSDRLRGQADHAVISALETYAALLDEENSQLAVNYGLMWDEHIIEHPYIGANLSLERGANADLHLAVPIEQACNDTDFKRRFAFSHGFLVRFERRLTGVRRAARQTLDMLEPEPERSR